MLIALTLLFFAFQSSNTHLELETRIKPRRNCLKYIYLISPTIKYHNNEKRYYPLLILYSPLRRGAFFYPFFLPKFNPTDALHSDATYLVQ